CSMRAVYNGAGAVTVEAARETPGAREPARVDLGDDAVGMDGATPAGPGARRGPHPAVPVDGGRDEVAAREEQRPAVVLAGEPDEPVGAVEDHGAPRGVVVRERRRARVPDDVGGGEREEL